MTTVYAPRYVGGARSGGLVTVAKPATNNPESRSQEMTERWTTWPDHLSVTIEHRSDAPLWFYEITRVVVPGDLVTHSRFRRLALNLCGGGGDSCSVFGGVVPEIRYV